MVGDVVVLSVFGGKLEDVAVVVALVADEASWC